VTYHASWIDPARARCYQIMKRRTPMRSHPGLRRGTTSCTSMWYRYLRPPIIGRPLDEVCTSIFVL
jgi:hypothetical protein